MADIFLSYKRERRAAVAHLAEVLHLYGFSVWYDYALETGDDFGVQIERELRAAKAAVVLWCSLSKDSEWVLEEATLAKMLGIFVPTWLEKVDPPLGFIRSDTKDLSRWDGAPFSPEITALALDLGKRVGFKPQLDVQAAHILDARWRRLGAPTLQTFATLNASPEPEIRLPTLEQARLAEEQQTQHRREAAAAEAEQAKRAEMDAARREAARLEAERLEAAERDAAEAEERLQQARRAAEARADAARREADRLEQERLEAEKAEAALLVAREKEAARRLAAERALARVAPPRPAQPKPPQSKLSQPTPSAPAASRWEPFSTFRDRLKNPHPAPGFLNTLFGVSKPQPDEPVFGPEMIALPAGSFTMGAPPDEPGRYYHEGPQHQVDIAQPFALGKYAVTFEEYDRYAAAAGVKKPEDQGWGRGRRPVINVSWDDAQGYCRWLSEQTGAAYRLPSEAEWEYACRAGTAEATYAGAMEILGANNAPILDSIAWYGGNSGVGFEPKDGVDSSGWPEKQYEHTKAGTRVVGMKSPNAWGLHDTLGNVREWCADQWHRNYDGAPTDGFARSGASGAAARVVRGGSCHSFARNVRSAYRYGYDPLHRDDYLGFRCARGQGEPRK